MATAFHQYIKSVKLTVNAVDYTIPVWDLSVRAQSWVGSETIAQQAPDGSWRQKMDGWHIFVDFSGDFAWGTSANADATTAIESLYNVGSGTLDLDPVDDPGVKVLTVVPREGNSPAEAVFNSKIRNRPQSISLVTQTLQASIPTWLTGVGDELTAASVTGAGTEILLIGGRGVTQSSGDITAWADQSGNANDFSTGSNMPASNSYGWGWHAAPDSVASFLRTANNGPLNGLITASTGLIYIWMVVRIPASVANEGTLLLFADPAAMSSYTLLGLNSNALRVLDSGANTASGAISLSDDDAHLIEMEMDPVADTVTFFVDGVEDTSSAWTVGLNGSQTATCAVWIGDGNAADTQYNAWIPFLMIDSAAPSATRLLQSSMAPDARPARWSSTTIA